MQILPLVSIIVLFSISGTGMVYGDTDGTVSLDKTQYPIPFGIPSDFFPTLDKEPSGRAILPIHPFGQSNSEGLGDYEFNQDGQLEVLILIDDQDFNLSPSAKDILSVDTLGGVGPVKVSVIRGSDVVVLGYVGGTTYSAGLIDVGDDSPTTAMQDTHLYETGTDTGIFQYHFNIEFTDGPASSACPPHLRGGLFDTLSDPDESYCILKGDILKVEYTDISDSSGNTSTVTATAQFSPNDSELKTDRSAYLVGSDMILTLIDPDLDLSVDPDSHPLDLIGWNSDAATLSMGYLGGEEFAFDPDPPYLQETGESTGIFQTVVKFPVDLNGAILYKGKEITLEYVDWSPSSALHVGSESNTATATVHSSGFKVSIKLDQRAYSWTDLVLITVIARDFNLDPDVRDEIGGDDTNPIKISTRGYELNNYKFVESRPDSGIFYGSLYLTGFAHDVNGDGISDTDPRTGGSGSNDGLLETYADDEITVSFEFDENQFAVDASPIALNMGEIEWETELLTSYLSTVRVDDIDMNLISGKSDKFHVHVWSDTDDAGIDLLVSEHRTKPGVFKGDIVFRTEGESYANVLRVTEGDMVTAVYTDYTLPEPYSTSDRFDVAATLYIPKDIPSRDIQKDFPEPDPCISECVVADLEDTTHNDSPGSDPVIDTAAPIIESIVTSEYGIKMTGSEPLAGDVKVSDFAVSGRAEIAISSVSISGSVIDITLDGKIAEGEVINLSYLGSSVTDLAGNALETLDRTVKNTIPKDSPDPKPSESRPESSSDSISETITEPEPALPAEPPCGPGTYASNGVCIVDDRDDIFSIIIRMFENLLG